MSKISIIIPVYNIEKYLNQCLDSVINQTFKDLEIICVDDGSTDRCPYILEQYAVQDNRIKIIHKENGGIVSARKAGLRAAQGEYIGYVDSDDWIDSDMYEQMYQKMVNQNVDIIMCGRYEDTGNRSKQVYHGITEGKYDKYRLKKYVYPEIIVGSSFFEWGIFPGVWDKLFRRNCLEKYQMEVDEKIVMGEDAACTYPALLNANSIYIMNKCLYHYRQTTTSMVKSSQNYERERMQFKILYNTVNSSFERDKDIFDLREQWLKYVLFLMIPRADSLYRNFNKLDYLFPFREVSKGSDIILYGAGTYGQRLYNYIKKTQFCKVVLWLDRNYAELKKMGLNVNDPVRMKDSNCNTVVIANTYAKSRISLYSELKELYPLKKIYMIDEDEIFSEQTIKAFEL